MLRFIRRSVFPTATGRTPPSFFRRPISFAPKKKGLNPTGILPSKTIFSTLVSFWRNSLTMGPLLFAMRSLYNWGTSRLGSPGDPEGKELMPSLQWAQTQLSYLRRLVGHDLRLEGDVLTEVFHKCCCQRELLCRQTLLVLVPLGRYPHRAWRRSF